MVTSRPLLSTAGGGYPARNRSIRARTTFGRKLDADRFALQFPAALTAVCCPIALSSHATRGGSDD
jgi:hypothetical protein